MSAEQRFGGVLGDTHMGDVARAWSGDLIRASGLRSEDLGRANMLADQIVEGTLRAKDMAAEDWEILKLFHPVLAYDLEREASNA
ncbi:MAG: hypothetical protein Q7R60_00925 [bacterium]|nr:hypothetical protein [bacterium]